MQSSHFIANGSAVREKHSYSQSDQSRCAALVSCISGVLLRTWRGYIVSGDIGLAGDKDGIFVTNCPQNLVWNRIL